jgi:hypothetical protein
MEINTFILFATQAKEEQYFSLNSYALRVTIEQKYRTNQTALS